jgi:L-alanine-DL-glutamate epimerase-like enolase superfamily enzyme
MRIVDISATPISVPVKNGATLAIGRAVKRDAVVVKVVTEDGLTGYGESHHARSPAVIAQIVNTTLKDIVLPARADDVIGIWQRIYQWQLRSHGMGAAVVMAMSGLDMALWDIRAKAAGWPLHVLLGAAARPIRAYGGGVALGWQAPETLVDEIAPLVEAGFQAVKLRVGDQPQRDIERVTAVRRAFGDKLTILVDANTGYELEDIRLAMPAFEALGVAWLEEPFAPHDYDLYKRAAAFGRVPLAAGENHYTRFEFTRLIEDRALSVLQPDLSKAGGVSEVMRIAAMASGWKLPICPHSSMTGLNMAATIHLLMAVDNRGYFEADVSPVNPFRDQLTSKPYRLEPDGTVSITDRPGIGLEVDEDFLRAHPFIPGRNFV